MGVKEEDRGLGPPGEDLPRPPAPPSCSPAWHRRRLARAGEETLPPPAQPLPGSRALYPLTELTLPSEELRSHRPGSSHPRQGS